MGIFALFCARLSYIRQHSSFYKKSIIMLISSFLIIIAGYFIYASPFFFRMEQLVYGGSASDINRLTLIQEAIGVWLINLKTFVMGIGYDNFRLFSALQSYSHSTPLELLSCTGIVGFFLFMGFLYLLVRKFILLYKFALDRESRTIMFSILIFLFIFLFFTLAAVMHDSRELLPILGALAAFGQYHFRLLEVKARESKYNSY